MSADQPPLDELLDRLKPWWSKDCLGEFASEVSEKTARLTENALRAAVEYGAAEKEGLWRGTARANAVYAAQRLYEHLARLEHVKLNPSEARSGLPEEPQALYLGNITEAPKYSKNMPWRQGTVAVLDPIEGAKEGEKFRARLITWDDPVPPDAKE